MLKKGMGFLEKLWTQCIALCAWVVMRNLSWMLRSKNGTTTWSDNLAAKTNRKESNLVQDQGLGLQLTMDFVGIGVQIGVRIGVRVLAPLGANQVRYILIWISIVCSAPKRKWNLNQLWKTM